MRKSFLKFFLAAFLVLTALLLGLSLLLQSPRFQTYLAQKATTYLSKELNTNLSIEKVNIDFFNSMVLENIYIEDLNSDTLIHADRLRVDFDGMKIFSRLFHINRIHLDKSKVNFTKKEDESHYNFQFILDYFSGDEKSAGGVKWDVDLKVVALYDSRFTFHDQNSNLKMDIALPVSHFDIYEFLPTQNILDFNAIYIDRPNINISYEDSEAHITNDEEIIEKAMMALNPGSFNLYVEKTKISNGYFALTNKSRSAKAESGFIDFNHLKIDDIQIDFENTELIGDTIFSNINMLSFKEQSGFNVNELKATAEVSPNTISLKNLSLRTSDSYISDYFVLNYNSFNDFDDFLNEVTLEGNFNNSVIHLKDINYFTDGELNDISHNSFYLDGNLRGTVGQIRGRDLIIAYGTESIFRGDILVIGLPDINETFMDLKVDESLIHLDDIAKFHPGTVIPDALRALGKPNFNGRFTGFYYDFVANGTLQNDLGLLTSDLNLKLVGDDRQAIYSGNLSAERFRLDRWTEDADFLKTISFDLAIEGSGLTYEQLEAKMEGKIHSFYLFDYEYTDIVVDGIINQKLFSGNLNIDDENLALDFEGFIDLNQTLPTYNFNANIKNADLKALNIYEEPLIFSTNFFLDAKGDNFKNFSGNAVAYDMNLFDGTDDYYLDSIKLQSVYLRGQERQLRAETDFFTANILGDFNINELQNAVLHYAQTYFYSYLTDFDEPEEVQDIRFNIVFHHPDEKQENFYQLAPFLKPLAGGYLSGSFNNVLSSLELYGYIPMLEYEGFALDSLYLLATSGQDQLDIDVGFRSARYNDSTIIDNSAHLMAIASLDSILFNVKVNDSEDLNRFDVSGVLAAGSDFVSLDLFPFEIMLNKKLWVMNLRTPITLSREQLLIENLSLESGWQSININSFITHNNENNINVRFTDVELNDFSQSLLSFLNIEMEGLINGHVNFSNILKSPVAYAVLTINNLKLENESIGDLDLLSNYSFKNKILNINTGVRDAINDFTLSLELNLMDNKNEINGNLYVNRFELSVLENFLQEYVSNIHGHTDGLLTVKGTIEEPEINGELYFYETGTTVNYLNVHYKMDNQKIEFQPYWIDLTGLTITDNENNTANVGGYLLHDKLKDWVLSIFVNTQNFTFLNTTSRDNNLYYGKALAGGTVLFSGSMDDISIYISAKTNRNTVFHIPISSSRNVGQYSFFRFVDKENGDDEDEFKVKANNLTVSIELEVTPDAEVQIIFDQQQGDIIKGKGFGNLNMEVSQYGEFNMYGNYQIQQGDYLFTLQNIVNKKFLIDQGGTISWTGNPYEAQLSMSAIYNLRTAPYELIRDMITENDQLKQARNRIPVNLYMSLSGSLLQPDINFDIRVPDAAPDLVNAIENKIQVLKNDENELNKQVFGLLVLNRFLPSYNLDNTLGAENPLLTSGMNNTVSEFLSNQFSMYFSDIISEFVTDIDFNVKYRTYQYDYPGIENPEDFENRRELHLALTKRFFDDRVSVDVGGNFDFGSREMIDPDIGERTNSIAGDFRVEYLIKPDGRLRVKAFRNSHYDILIDRNRNKTGVGIFYREEFDHIREIWTRNRNKEDKQNQDKLREEEEESEETPDLPEASK